MDTPTIAMAKTSELSTALPFKGLFAVADTMVETLAESMRQTAGNIFDHGERLFKAGGLTVMLSKIKATATEMNRAGVSEKVSALGILAMVNPGLKSHRVVL
jgi:hypothetical protein